MLVILVRTGAWFLVEGMRGASEMMVSFPLPIQDASPQKRPLRAETLCYLTASLSPCASKRKKKSCLCACVFF